MSNESTTNPESNAKEVRDNLIRRLEEKVAHAEKARQRAWDDRDDASERHYMGARNAYRNALWMIAEAVLPPDEFATFRRRDGERTATMTTADDYCDHCGAILEEDPVLVAWDEHGGQVELSAEEAEDIEHERLCDSCACDTLEEE